MAHRPVFILEASNAKYITQDIWDMINSGRMILRPVMTEKFKLKIKCLELDKKARGALR